MKWLDIQEVSAPRIIPHGKRLSDTIISEAEQRATDELVRDTIDKLSRAE